MSLLMFPSFVTFFVNSIFNQPLPQFILTILVQFCSPPTLLCTLKPNTSLSTSIMFAFSSTNNNYVFVIYLFVIRSPMFWPKLYLVPRFYLFVINFVCLLYNLHPKFKEGVLGIYMYVWASSVMQSVMSAYFCYPCITIYKPLYPSLT